LVEDRVKKSRKTEITGAWAGNQMWKTRTAAILHLPNFAMRQIFNPFASTGITAPRRGTDTRIEIISGLF
jgi:hypothetical protein